MPKRKRDVSQGASKRQGPRYKLKERVQAAEAYTRGYFVQRNPETGEMERIPATLRSLGKRYGVSHERIRSWLSEMEIRMRDPGFQDNGNRRKPERVLKRYKVEIVRTRRTVTPLVVEAFSKQEAARQAKGSEGARPSPHDTRLSVGTVTRLEDK